MPLAVTRIVRPGLALNEIMLYSFCCQFCYLLKLLSHFTSSIVMSKM